MNNSDDCNSFSCAQELFVQKRYREAQHCLDRILANEPRHGPALHVRGLIYALEHDTPKALACLEEAASLCPTDPQIHYNYGSLLQTFLQYDKALLEYEKASALDPGYLLAVNNAGVVKYMLGRLTEAEADARAILKRDPGYFDAYNNLGNYLKDQGRLPEAMENYRHALSLRPHDPIARSNLLLCLCYRSHDRHSVFLEHKKWEEMASPGPAGYRGEGRSGKVPKRPLRIGYVSADFKTHSVAYFFIPILEHFNRALFETYCYSDVERPDPVTRYMENKATVWRPIAALSDEEAAALIERDAIDILVDLAGHAGNRRLPLFLRKRAPVQVTYLGYPNTTGLSSIDYRITDALADPEGQDSFHTETLYRLNRCFLCYKPPMRFPETAPPPALKNGYVTFGSFNNFPKISEETISLWASILHAVKDSRLMLKCKSFRDASVQNRIRNLFSGLHIDAHRLLLFPHAGSTEQHLACYNDVDIALDTVPYNGTTTTCEALWMGVPVVTLAGDRHAGRVGFSIVSCAGLPGLAAHSPQHYIACARFLAGDIPQLSLLRSRLRNAIAQSPLCDGPAFAGALEQSFMSMWESGPRERTACIVPAPPESSASIGDKDP